MKLYETNSMFDKTQYASLLNKMNIRAEAVESGVMIDMEQYKANYHGAIAPHMVYMNHKFVKKMY